jgi:hypothetical protein
MTEWTDKSGDRRRDWYGPQLLEHDPPKRLFSPQL